MIFVVDGIPPNVNNYVRHTRAGRHYQTDDALKFKTKVHIAAEKAFRDDGFTLLQRIPQNGEEKKRRQKAKWLGTGVPGEAFRLDLTVYLGAGDKGDCDNFCKVAIDALVAAGVMKSDDMIHQLYVTKRRDRKFPRTEYGIIAIQPQT